MDSFPIELLEHILEYCTGSSMSRSARLSTNWLKAVENIERTNGWFWRKCCLQEIDGSVLEDLNPYHNQSIDELNGNQCKRIYQKWFCSQHINKWPKTSLKYSQTFGTKLNGFENISAITVSGTLVITGHRSGRVLLLDVYNNHQKPVLLAAHMSQVNDLAPVNMVGDEKYELHKRNGYPNDNLSYSNHHHIISVGEDSRIYISFIGGKDIGQQFEICPLSIRNFLKVRICRDLFAVSTKEAVDISLFRMVLPKTGVVPIKDAIKAELITTVSCRQVFHSAHHWLGLFSFSDLMLNCFCHEFNLIASSDVSTNLAALAVKKTTFRWKWNSINELIYEFRSKAAMDGEWDDLSLRIVNGFSFGNGVFFLITSHNQTVYTTDSKTFRLCPLEHWLKPYDKITSIALLGSVLACGTDWGYIYVHHCPSLKRLHYLTHYKPLLEDRLCTKAILRLSIGDNGLGPVLAAASKRRVYVLNWSSQMFANIKPEPEVIEIED